MNIFKILKRGDGTINEANISSFLAYLLDPKETHGLEQAFLEIFLESLNISTNTAIAEVGLEKRQSDTTTKNASDIDIVIKITDDNRENIDILIENKIEDKSATNENQLVEQRSRYIMNNHAKSIISVLLAPDGEKSNSLFDKLLDSDNKIRIYWQENANNKDKSIVEMLKKLFEMERSGKIPPINYTTKYLSMCFFNFIIDNFGKQSKAGRDYAIKEMEFEDYADEKNLSNFSTELTKILITKVMRMINIDNDEMKLFGTKHYYSLKRNKNIFLKIQFQQNKILLGIKVGPNYISKKWKPEPGRESYVGVEINNQAELTEDIITDIITSFNSAI